MVCGGNFCYFGFGLFLFIFGFVIDVIGVVFLYWILVEVGGEKVYGGLWKICIFGLVVIYLFFGCVDFDEVLGIIIKWIYNFDFCKKKSVYIDFVELYKELFIYIFKFN